jgi:TerB N-terminal domain/TerB-C domain
MGQFVRTERHDAATAPTTYRATTPAVDGPTLPRPLNRHARWLSPGDPVSVGGHYLPGGMIYLGRRLRAARGGRTEPALVDPGLQLDQRNPDLDGKDLSYWPSYDTISPASRTAYLCWLAGGRRAPGVPIGYVFLFFYGLERRLLVDITADPALRGEVPALRAEVRALLDCYGSHRSFRRYAAEFANLLELVDSPPGTDPDRLDVPDLVEPRWPAPMTLRRALGAFAATGRPVPAEWALAWAWYHPDISLRTPVFRCREEFTRLFRQRYAAAHGDGLLVHAGTRYLRLEYEPASAGLRRSVYGRQDIPDVFLADTPRWQLTALMAQVTEELGAYSRWLHRHADLRDTIAGTALLPADLVVDADGRTSSQDAAALQSWLDRRLDHEDVAIVAADDLTAWWPTASAAPSRRDAAALARLLGHLGFGMEPDVRTGGPVPAAGLPVAIFRLAEDAAATAPTGGIRPPCADTSAGITFVRLAADILAADGPLGSAQLRRLVAQARTIAALSAQLLSRLHAHLRWALAANTGTLGLRRCVDALPADRRAAIGDLLVSVATAGGRVTPAQVAGLTAAFYRLGLDPDTVPSRLHTSLTTGLPAPPHEIQPRAPSAEPSARPTAGPTNPARPAQSAAASGPVTVRPAAGAVGDFLLPPRPAPAERAEHAEPTGLADLAGPAEHGEPVAPAKHAEPTSRQLDPAVIAAKQAESATVSALLGSIFGDDPADVPAEEPSLAAGPGLPTEAQADLVTGLDAPHSALLRALAARPAWNASDFDALAAKLGLLPAGALDVLNDAALDATGDPVASIEGDITIDTDVLQELLG